MNLEVYGFGSFFYNPEHYNDIDFLIVHNTIEYDSCINAILFKREILTQIDKASVTMLSISEERKFDFIKKSLAIHLLSYSGGERHQTVILLRSKIDEVRRRIKLG